MKGALKSFLVFLLWVVVLLLAAGGLFLACAIFDLPKEAAFAGLGLLLAAILVVFLVRRGYVRRKQRLQMAKLVSLDAGIEEAPEDRLIDNRWDRAVAIMRSARLGAWSPLYALPWYMVMGRTGAGKSSSIAHSGLSAMWTDVGPEADHPGTRNCDWHFFHEAVVMDTAGRYAVPLNEAADSAEWRVFLRKLAKYRRREPLNGLVLVVPADSLYGEGEHLLAEARCLRRRIDEIMRILGAKFPVYLMVSKLDLLAGMASLLESLPEERRKESFGVFIQSPEKKDLTPVDAQTKQALGKLAERMRALCLFSGQPGEPPSPQRLMAWEEFRAMLPALRAYAHEIFAPNPYQETPLFRGIFFSSALRDRQENSRAFPALAALARRALRIQENAGGFFLHDFFSAILPGDRNLHRPAAEYLRQRSSLRAVAYAALLLALFGVATLYSLSYHHNQAMLERMTSPGAVSAEPNMTQRMLGFEVLFRGEAGLEEAIDNYPLPNMGLDHARAALEAYSKRLCQAFFDSAINPATQEIQRRRAMLTAHTDDRTFFDLMSSLIWRYDMLHAVDEGKSFADILKIPAMPTLLLRTLGLEDQLAPSVAYSVARFAYDFHDRPALQGYMRAIRAEVARLPEIKGYSLRWLVHRAGAMATLDFVRGDSFWPGARYAPLADVLLDPAYTRAGMKATLDYLKDLSLILDNDKEFKPATDDFLRWYAAAYVTAWHDFARDFVTVSAPLATVSASSDIAALMSSDSNPYFQLLLRMDEELQAVRDKATDNAPAWMEELAVLAQAVRRERKESPQQEKESLVQKMTSGAKELYSNLSEEVDPAVRARDSKAEKAAKYLKTYLDTMRDLTRFTGDNSLAFTAIAEAMPAPENKNAASAPFTLAVNALHAVHAAIDPAMEEDSPAAKLLAAPLRFFADRMRNGASCQIQALWEGQVLSRAGTLSRSQLQQGLFAEQGGIVRDFADKTLGNFLQPALTGYEPVTLRGTPIPFTPEFLAFLNSGLEDYKPVRQDYGVTISAVPVDVNDGATETPWSVELALDCAKDRQSMTHYNNPTSSRFTWTKGSCGDTHLIFRFKSLSLEVVYTGENGFINFLRDFQYGSKTFQASDFPDQQALLRKLGIDSITPHYRITGADELLRSHAFTPGTLPYTAAECKR